jgi:hypothetical protein
MGILSFLGGTAFRWLFGEALDFLKRRQELANELALMQLQHEQDRDKHQWQQEAIKLHADMGVKVIEAQSEADDRRGAAEAFLAAVQGVNKASEREGVIGAWNASIRPLLATVAIFALVGESAGWITLSALFAEVSCAVLGVFVGERIRARNR